MNKEKMKRIVGSEYQKDPTGTLREERDYSGRFMYGKGTSSVYTESRDLVGYIKIKYKIPHHDQLGKGYIIY